LDTEEKNNIIKTTKTVTVTSMNFIKRQYQITESQKPQIKLITKNVQKQTCGTHKDAYPAFFAEQATMDEFPLVASEQLEGEFLRTSLQGK